MREAATVRRTSGGTRLRADARQNREQILAAAHTLFLEQGVGAPMEEVARQAGVGVGTLYRRFPDRAALIAAVAEDLVDRLVAEMSEARAEEPDAWHALCRFLRVCTRSRLALPTPDPSVLPHKLPVLSPALHRRRDELLAILDGLVRQAQADGDMRTDVGAGDVTMLIGVLIRRAPLAPAVMSERLPPRFAELMLASLRADAGGTLPGPPVGTDELVWRQERLAGAPGPAEAGPD